MELLDIIIALIVLLFAVVFVSLFLYIRNKHRSFKNLVSFNHVHFGGNLKAPQLISIKINSK